jgi:hypothetical protein
VDGIISQVIKSQKLRSSREWAIFKVVGLILLVIGGAVLLGINIKGPQKTSKVEGAAKIEERR